MTADIFKRFADAQLRYMEGSNVGWIRIDWAGRQPPKGWENFEAQMRADGEWGNPSDREPEPPRVETAAVGEKTTRPDLDGE